MVNMAADLSAVTGVVQSVSYSILLTRLQRLLLYFWHNLLDRYGRVRCISISFPHCAESMVCHTSMWLPRCAGSMAKAAMKSANGESAGGMRLTASPSMDHIHVRSDSADSLASLDAMHETDNLIPRRPMILPHWRANRQFWTCPWLEQSKSFWQCIHCS